MSSSISATQQKIPYLYITGQGFSGSTLLSFLLNTHPEMTTVGEVGPAKGVNTLKYVCSCGTPMRDCQFFVELEKQVNHLGSSFSLLDWKTKFQLSQFRLLNQLLVGSLRSKPLEQIRDKLVPFYPGFQREVEEISQRAVHLAQAALMIRNKTVFVDALKDPMRIKFLKDIEQIDLKIVHLVKDVRASVASVIKRMKTQNIAGAAHYWRRSNTKADQARRFVAPNRWLLLRYTDLCADPQGSIDRIADLMGIKRAPLPEDFYRVEHHIIGNQMRKKSSNIIKEDLAWKEKLAEHDLREIAKIAGQLNRYFGYDFP